jgi:hypothetical protein
MGKDRDKDTKDRIENTKVRNPKAKPKRLNLDTNNNMYSIEYSINTEHSIVSSIDKTRNSIVVSFQLSS